MRDWEDQFAEDCYHSSPACEQCAEISIDEEDFEEEL
jgi:catabolite regulation protein CreA